MARILIVDDDEQIRRLLAKLLGRAGYSVDVAENGRQAVRMMGKEPADLVITDIMMPDQDGIQTILELKREKPNVKIMAISGGGSVVPGSYLDQAEKLGADRVLAKPLQLDEVLEAVVELLSGAGRGAPDGGPATH
ncbi:MAG: response regulator [Dongiaceae bacterium]